MNVVWQDVFELVDKVGGSYSFTLVYSDPPTDTLEHCELNHLQLLLDDVAAL